VDAAFRTHPVGAGVEAIHGTAVEREGRALLILGPSGAGKSGLAAGMIALGARLVSDDRVELVPGPEGLMVRRPAGAPPLIELRGLGLVSAASVEAAPLVAALRLGASRARLPEPETLRLAGRDLPLLRHPAHPDLAAKLTLWLITPP
jgi:HPr kinase/phosphorylase